MIVPLVIALVSAAGEGEAAAAQGARTALVVRAAGFGDADVVRLSEKAGSEAGAVGVDVSPLAGAISPECLDDRVCVKDVLRAADAALLLRVELLRAGGQAQVTAIVVDKDGRAVAEATTSARVDALLGDEPLLPTSVVDVLRSSVTTSSPPPAPPDELAPEEPPQQQQQHPEQRGGDEAALSTMALVGIGAIGVGAIAATVGVAGALGQYAVIRDPSALGGAKTDAATLVPVLGGVGVVGVILAGVGGWLLWSELARD